MSRVLRRLQGKDIIERADEVGDTLEDSVGSRGGARRKTPIANPFNVLDAELSDSDTKEDAGEIETEENIEPGKSYVKKMKKKKRKADKTGANFQKVGGSPLEFDVDEFNDNIFDYNSKTSTSQFSECNTNESNLNSGEHYVSAINIKLKNLNANNELKKIFGVNIVENDSRRRNRGRVPAKTHILVNPKENWPPLGRTGISMKVEKVNGKNTFTFVHNSEYQKIQQQFLNAVDSLNPENIIHILNSHPYHVDSLIQLSDLYKLNDDLQMAADFNERALYCLEAAFHPLFNIGRGNCQLDYWRQENRPFFICLFKHLNFVGQRACCHTALELCKFLLLLDFDRDPLASILCMDFYSLRSRNYKWLIDATNEWEIKKNLSLLPNFTYSTALAHFFLAENNQTDFSTADKLLQNALILFPGVLSQLIDKCSIQCDPAVTKHRFFTTDAELGQNRSLSSLITLYVSRTFHEWKDQNILPWLERNVHIVLQRVDKGDPFVLECSQKRSKIFRTTPRKVLRHIILSDIKEVTSTIANEITSPILSFDPLPPVDSIDLYTRQEREHHYGHSPTLSLFLRSLLPNFNVNPQQGNRLFVNEAALGEGAGIQFAGQGAGGNMVATAAVGDTLRYSVTALMDAINVLLANMPMRDRGERVVNPEHQLRTEGDGQEENAPTHVQSESSAREESQNRDGNE